METKPGLRVWGRALQRAMADMPPADRAAFVQYLEAEAKREGNLEYLREIKAYKALASSPPASSPTSTPEPPAD